MTDPTQTLATGDVAEPVGVSSSRVKEQFGAYLDRSAHGEAFRIMRRGRESAVLMSWQAFQALRDAVPDPLASLRAEFDALVEGMATPGAAAASDAMLAAATEDLGAAALAGAVTPDSRRG